jgi:hypothetical protein
MTGYSKSDRDSIIAILQKARAFIIMGWTQGENARRANGERTNAHNPDATCFCLFGAVVRAIPTDAPQLWRGRIMVEIQWHTPGSMAPVIFNDLTSTRQADVIRVLDATILDVAK